MQRWKAAKNGLGATGVYDINSNSLSRAEWQPASGTGQSPHCAGFVLDRCASLVTGRQDPKEFDNRLRM